MKLFIKMTAITIYFNEIMECLSQEMIYKLEYACQAYIIELLILKNNEEEKGNTEKYNWLNIVNYQNRIQGIIDRMLNQRPLLESVITDYFVPEDVLMLRKFVDNYSIYVYNYTQEVCNIHWTHRSNTYNMFNPKLYSNMIFELGMDYYMNLHPQFVLNNLYHVNNTNNEILK